MSKERGAPSPRWLNAGEKEAWVGLLHLLVELPQALDRQLRAEAGLGHVYYAILATCSARPQRTCGLSDLARSTGTSLSRLSHAVDALEERGLLARCRTADSARPRVRLTDEGMALLEEIAPSHVEEVRRLVFDRLDPEEVRALAHLTAKLAPGIRSAVDRPSPHSDPAVPPEPGAGDDASR